MVSTRAAARSTQPTLQAQPRIDPVKNGVEKLGAKLSASALTETGRGQKEQGSHSAMTMFSDKLVTRVLQRILDHITGSLAAVDAIQPAQLLYEREVAEIKLRLGKSFSNLRETHPDDGGTIENDIVRYAGRLRLVEMNGLRDAEIAREDQATAVLQAFTDLLLTEVPSCCLQASLQKMASGELKPNLDSLQVMPLRTTGGDEDGLNNKSHAPTRIAESEAKETQGHRLKDHLKRPQSNLKPLVDGKINPCYGQEEDQNRKRMKLDTATVPCEQQLGNELDLEQEFSITVHVDSDAESSASSHEEELSGDGEATQGTVVLNVIDGGKSAHELTLRSRGNELADRILKRPIKRPVQLVGSTVLSQDSLEAICGDEIIASIIQASGDLMEKPCTNCREGHGVPFDKCIMVIDDAAFYRCGNCEWVDGSCLDASTTTVKEHSRNLPTK